jgi:hypothetical protein
MTEYADKFNRLSNTIRSLLSTLDESNILQVTLGKSISVLSRLTAPATKRSLSSKKRDINVYEIGYVILRNIMLSLGKVEIQIMQFMPFFDRIDHLVTNAYQKSLDQTIAELIRLLHLSKVQFM